MLDWLSFASKQYPVTRLNRRMSRLLRLQTLATTWRVVYVLKGMDVHRRIVNIKEMEDYGTVKENYEVVDKEEAWNTFGVLVK